MVEGVDSTGAEKRGRKFGSYFAVATSVLIAIAIIFTTFYFINAISILTKDYHSAVNGYNNMIKLSVIKSYLKDQEEHKKAIMTYDNVQEASNVFIASGYLKYVIVYNRENNIIMWASQPEYVKQNKFRVARKFLNGINIKHGVRMVELQADNDVVLMGFVANTVENSDYKNIFNNLKFYVVAFLLIGIVISAFMSKMINKPLINVVSGVEEFSKGNFNYRLKDTGFEEIDKLVGAYNHMSGQLSELYESLEAKVEERTKELEKANLKLKETQTMMVHSEKMRSLGELVAGIAHEINNPINFIYGNIMILDNYQKDLMELVAKYTAAEGDINPQAIVDIQNFKQKIDLDFIRDDIGDLIKSCMEGVERTKNIILDLKNFSRMDEMVFSECYIPKEIDTTLNILNNKIKNRITIHKDYEENLPKIEAYGGQINQVFMNIIDNAQGAIKGEGDIYISVHKAGKSVSIEFRDTGCGIKQEDVDKIFEPFYTTKPAGQGTGLGMSIAYRVIKAHNGDIKVESEVGKGTKITLTLPIEHQEPVNPNIGDIREQIEKQTS